MKTKLKINKVKTKRMQLQWILRNSLEPLFPNLKRNWTVIWLRLELQERMIWRKTKAKSFCTYALPKQLPLNKGKSLRLSLKNVSLCSVATAFQWMSFRKLRMNKKSRRSKKISRFYLPSLSLRKTRKNKKKRLLMTGSLVIFAKANTKLNGKDIKQSTFFAKRAMLCSGSLTLSSSRDSSTQMPLKRLRANPKIKDDHKNQSHQEKAKSN